METVTVSPKFQVVIPKKARQSLDIQVGQKMHVLVFEDRLELIPLETIQEARGFLKGIDTGIKREPDRL
jgi:AbrB family looped-hinge helix DNA binding protein